MKKRMVKKVICLFLTVILAAATVGCGDDKSGSQDTAAQPTESTSTEAPVADTTETATEAPVEEQESTEAQDDGASAETPLIGTWKYGDSFAYIFNEGGKGVYDAAGTKMNFTYEDNGDSVNITFEGNTQGEDFKYHIDGDTLVIEDSFGEEVTYVKE